MEAYKPTQEGFQYKVIIGIIYNSGGRYLFSEEEVVNDLAREGWRVVSSTNVGDRSLAYTLERKLQ